MLLSLRRPGPDSATAGGKRFRESLEPKLTHPSLNLTHRDDARTNLGINLLLDVLGLTSPIVNAADDALVGKHLQELLIQRPRPILPRSAIGLWFTCHHLTPFLVFRV